MSREGRRTIRPATDSIGDRARRATLPGSTGRRPAPRRVGGDAWADADAPASRPLLANLSAERMSTLHLIR